jgi:hypothetical protein
MSILLGVTLSLTLSAGPAGSNGFDPSSVYVFYEMASMCSPLPGTGAAPDCFAVEPGQSAEFVTWFQTETAMKAKSLKYFVECALPANYTVRFNHGGTRYEWTGRYGLADWTTRKLAVIQKAKKGAAQLILPADEGKWVSACLMALSNTAGSHEYVWLRGVPPAWRGQATNEAMRWTMDYPEGVFFADVLNFNIGIDQHTGEPTRQRTQGPLTRALLEKIKTQLEQSYTLSLNLPDGYHGAGPAGWAPPNGSNGRTLDFEPETSGPDYLYRVAKKLGTYKENRSHFHPVPTQGNPDDWASQVCVDATSGHEKVVDCTKQASPLRPLFVHAPRVASFGAASKAPDFTQVIQAIDTGAALVPEQWKSCIAGKDCTGPFKLISQFEEPTAPSPLPLPPARTLTGLTAKQAITVVLRRFPRSPAPASPGGYTAIVRYRSKVPATATVKVSDASPMASAGMREAGSTWPATPTEPGQDWQWLQVYPVDAVIDPNEEGGATLKIVISGKEGGGPAPELDIAGFVAGPPRCARRGPPVMKVCGE